MFYVVKQNPYSHITVLFCKSNTATGITKPLLTHLFYFVNQTLLHKALTHTFVLCYFSDVVDVCDVDRLTLSNERQTGTIVFNGPYTAEQNPCVLRLQALPSSFIFIRSSNTFNFIWCSQRSMPPLCTPGYVIKAKFYHHHINIYTA